MISKKHATLNTLILVSVLFLSLVYSLAMRLEIPINMIVTTTGGGLMNLGFWIFYNQTIRPIPQLRKSILGKNRHAFLFSSILHLLAIIALSILAFDWPPQVPGL